MKGKYVILIVLVVLVLAGVIYYAVQKTNKTIAKATDKVGGDINNAAYAAQALAAKSGDFRAIADDAVTISGNINQLLGAFKQS